MSGTVPVYCYDCGVFIRLTVVTNQDAFKRGITSLCNACAKKRKRKEKQDG